MPQPMDNASALRIASNSIPTTDTHQATLREEIPCTQELTNAHDLEVHTTTTNNNLGANNNGVVQVGPRCDYNTNNWSVHEMLVLQAAKLEFERNLNARNHPNKNKIGERFLKISSKERWTWIENACWTAGVFRSQKQCHDKWEGITTQFRKVERFNEKVHRSNLRNSESNVVDDYWSMLQSARKQNKLPANFSIEVFEALRKNHFGGGGGTTAPDYSTLKSGFKINDRVDGEDDHAARANPPNKKKKSETSDEGGRDNIATAILIAVDRADERHKELMEFERAKFEFAKEKFHGFANLGNGFVRALISINDTIQRERLDSDRATTHGKS